MHTHAHAHTHAHVLPKSWTRINTHPLAELSVEGRRLDRTVRFDRPCDGNVRQRVAGRPHPPPEALRVVGLFDAGDLPQAGACVGRVRVNVVRVVRRRRGTNRRGFKLLGRKGARWQSGRQKRGGGATKHRSNAPLTLMFEERASSQAVLLKISACVRVPAGKSAAHHITAQRCISPLPAPLVVQAAWYSSCRPLTTFLSKTKPSALEG